MTCLADTLGETTSKRQYRHALAGWAELKVSTGYGAQNGLCDKPGLSFPKCLQTNENGGSKT